MKKIISLLTVLMLSLQMTTAFAAAPTVTAGTATGKAGETVDITISLADCAPWMSIALEVGYDSDVFSVTKATKGESGATFTKGADGKNPYNFSLDSSENVDFGKGLLATLTFEIAADAAPGTYPITVDFYKGLDGLNTDGWDVNYDEDYCELGLTYVAGSITVEGDEVKTTLAATKADGAVSITATAAEITGKFIVAGYDADGLVDVEVIDAAATATASVEGDTIKVMWWDSIDGMNSIVPAVIAE